MDWDTFFSAFGILLVVVVTFIVAGAGYLGGRYDFNKELQTTKLYCNNLTMNWSEDARPAKGIAWDAWDIFCVNTKDKTIKDVLQTCAHEYGHTNLGLEDRK